MLHVILLMAITTDVSEEGIAAERVAEESDWMFLEPDISRSPYVEVFKDVAHNLEYEFHTQAATWSQARIICERNGSTLAELTTLPLAMYVSEALVESVLGNRLLWIGARKTNGSFRWLKSDQEIHTDSEIFPKWAPVTHSADEELCVAVGRESHHFPVFVKLSCLLQRPFICQGPPSTKKQVRLLENPERIGNTMYYLYDGEVSWSEAVEHCNSQKSQLAALPNGEIVDKIGRRMLRSRPALEDVWIGGSYDEDKMGWYWVSNATEPIPLERNGASGYPPWFGGKVTNTSGCILLDRHLCETPLFLPGSCMRKKAFICQKEIDHVWLGGRIIFPDGELEWLFKNGTKVTVDELVFLTNRTKTGTALCDSKEERRKEMPCLNLDRENHRIPMVYGLNCNLQQHFICTIN
ncbi:lymphocyte antigen 75 isoform X2 [Anabrus simplex]|uniref:lymphocyte antigen 75 isoform X2 n=1 Tax=Anabrus simplex TaxID=316456 RepID=UPI0035A33BC2